MLGHVPEIVEHAGGCSLLSEPAIVGEIRFIVRLGFSIGALTPRQFAEVDLGPCHAPGVAERAEELNTSFERLPRFIRLPKRYLRETKGAERERFTPDVVELAEPGKTVHDQVTRKSCLAMVEKMQRAVEMHDRRETMDVAAREGSFASFL